MIFQSRNLYRLTQKAIGPFLVLSVIGYFLYHFIQGDRGVLAWMQLQKRLTSSLEHLACLKSEREALEEKVKALHPESLNSDLLDQEVRQKLGHVHPDEIVIIKPSPKDGDSHGF